MIKYSRKPGSYQIEESTSLRVKYKTQLTTTVKLRLRLYTLLITEVGKRVGPSVSNRFITFGNKYLSYSEGNRNPRDFRGCEPPSNNTLTVTLENSIMSPVHSVYWLKELKTYNGTFDRK